MGTDIRTLSGLSSRAERDRALRWLARLAEPDRARIVMAAFETLLGSHLGTHAPGMLEPASEVGAYCALLMAIRAGGFDTIRRRGYRVAGQKQYEDFSAVRLSRAANLKAERPCPVRRQVERLWAEIVELRANGHGFRVIARYLQQQRRMPHVSEAYLRKLWREHGGSHQRNQTL